MGDVAADTPHTPPGDLAAASMRHSRGYLDTLDEYVDWWLLANILLTSIVMTCAAAAKKEWAEKSVILGGLRELLTPVAQGSAWIVRVFAPLDWWCAPPPKPAKFEALGVKTDQVMLVWKPGKVKADWWMQDYLTEVVYVVETSRDFKEWHTMADSVKENAIDIGMKKGQAEWFRIRAKNQVGVSEPTEWKLAQTLGELNKHDGGDCDLYSWGQGKFDLSCRVPLPWEASSKDLTVEVHPTTILIAYKGKKMVDGPFHKPIVPDDLTWMIEEEVVEEEKKEEGELTIDNSVGAAIEKMKKQGEPKKMQKMLVLEMRKRDIAKWPRLVKGDREIDAESVIFGSKWLGTYKGDLGVKSY